MQVTHYKVRRVSRETGEVAYLSDDLPSLAAARKEFRDQSLQINHRDWLVEILRFGMEIVK